MKFSLKEDVSLPAEALFAAVSDFSWFERNARQRGATIEPLKDKPHAGWDIRFPYRGRQRRIELYVASQEPPREIRFAGDSANLDLQARVGVVQLSRERSRLTIDIEVRPKTMTARLLIQSAKLAKGRIERKLSARLSSFARRCEANAGRA